MPSHVSSIVWNPPTSALTFGNSQYVNAGDEITLTYNFSAKGGGGITNIPKTDYVLLNNGVKAFYYAGNGTNAITFKYVVQPGDTASALGQTDTRIYTASGTAEPNNVINVHDATSSAPTSAIVVDTSAPSYGVGTAILSADSGSSASDLVTKTAAQNITGTLTSPLQAGDSVRVSLDNGTTWQTATAAPGSTGFALNNVVLPSAANTLVAQVVDRAGNVGATQFSHDYTLDTAPPAAPVIVAAFDDAGPLQGSFTGGGRTDDAAPALTGTAERGATVRIYLDGGTSPVATTTADASGKWSYTPATELSQGLHGFTATATDAAGNASGTSATFEVMVDETLCYLEGTQILTPTGEVPIQYLKIGDTVVTRWAGIQPIKWIGRQSFSAQSVQGNRSQLPVRIQAGALGDRLPARTLFVSPGHSMLVGGTLVLARSLVNGVTITQAEAPGTINYFQIELEAHDCVIAEGAWSESYADCDGQRDRFHNAAEFEALYPNHRPPGELRLCAPRPERGPKLDEALRPVVARASAGLKYGLLRGSIDRIAGAWKIEGWAQDVDHPELPVLLEVLLDDQVIGTVLACDHRKDLLDSGLGQGQCSFVFDSPTKIRPEAAGTLRIRRACDGAEIRMSADCKAHIGPASMRRGAERLRLVS